MRANSSIGRGMAAVALLLAVGAAPAGAQVPRTLVDFGAPVFPSYEGWYENSDGSITLLVGYFNSNTEEVVDIPGRREQLHRAGPGIRGLVGSEPHHHGDIQCGR